MAAANPTVDDLGAGSDPGVGSDPEEAVRTPRTNMFIAAVVEWSGATHPVTIRNLSLDGALIEGATMPPVGTVRNFVCGRAVEHYAAMALMKRSPKMTANWALAMDHSRGGIFHSFSDRFKIR